MTCCWQVPRTILPLACGGVQPTIGLIPRRWIVWLSSVGHPQEDRSSCVQITSEGADWLIGWFSGYVADVFFSRFSMRLRNLLVKEGKKEFSAECRWVDEFTPTARQFRPRYRDITTSRNCFIEKVPRQPQSATAVDFIIISNNNNDDRHGLSSSSSR